MVQMGHTNSVGMFIRRTKRTKPKFASDRIINIEDIKEINFKEY